MGLDRPKIIIHSIASIDGKSPTPAGYSSTDGKWEVLPKGNKTISRWIIRNHQVNAVLDGSESFVPNSYGPINFEGQIFDEELLLTHYLPREIIKNANNRWYCVIDTQGRIEWSIQKISREDGQFWTLVILVTESTPVQYLSFLRTKEIPYLVVGKKFVDLQYAMSELHNVMEIETIVSESSGMHNGGLLSANLIDEINLEFVPTIIGESSSPNLFGSFEKNEYPVKLKLKSIQILKDGTIWTRFLVEGPWEPD